MTQRVTVALIPRAVDDLKVLRTRTGLSKTGIVNRAVSLYAFVDGQMREGRQLATYDPTTETFQVVHIA